MNVPIVRLENISKSYPGDETRQVLQNLSLSFLPGDRLAIVGPSGSGKSTLLNLIGTLDTPDSGEVWIEDESVSQRSENALARLRCEKIGFIFQLHHLLPQCTVLENVLVPAIARSPSDPEAKERAQRLLKRVGLADHSAKFPGQLSGGERQRAAVVRSLINRPKILLADEPTGALDEANAANLADLLLEITRAEGVALVLVTHDRHLAHRMDKVWELREGKLHPVAP